MDARDIRKWAADHRAVAARERAETRRNPLTGAQALAAALELLKYDESQNGFPFDRDDPVTRREVEQVREAWAKLRARWPHDR